VRGLDEWKMDVVALETRAPVVTRPAPRSARWPYVALIRPGQWPKNLVVALAPVLGGSLWRWPALSAVAFGALLFVGASCVVYILNDYADRDRDRTHPTKRWRPLASGAVRPAGALAFAAVLGTALLAAMALRPAPMDVPVLAYVVLNLAYSRVLKHIPPLDVFVLAAGFVLRVAVGGLAVHRVPSPWLLLAVLSLALLLGLGKRRREMALMESAAGAERHRPALRGYSRQLIDSLTAVAGAVAMVGYMSYLSVEVTGRPYGWLTVAVSTPLVMFGLARYLQLLVVGDGGGDPVRTLITDPPLVVVGFLWLLCFAVPPVVAAMTGA
jgi:4-hydroxybenzoate polyprenyltransferase